MDKLNGIGLDAAQSQQLAQQLNDLLANYSTFYQNVRGYHWKIRGEKFFELHLKFEELYNNLLMKIDEVAERILTLGFEPRHKYTEYLGISEIKETEETKDGAKAMEEILGAFKMLLIKQRQILNLAGEVGDEGTNALMSDYIREQEKLVWMYSAYLNR
ncbi:MAG: hypothetical protein KIPDCIKN_01923 [Haliscomenobacter sp.]|jgi:starvation-inducible DNA-binding protein|nr:hypothetical protein [Haliscomenobacter sp.]